MRMRTLAALALLLLSASFLTACCGGVANCNDQWGWYEPCDLIEGAEQSGCCN